ncbi:unnamed protein product [Amoebophrya sp. A25]|nr:unnamed protein product [Amoebophrya sp. A25]|eukprot:GSA25T00025473001.1
MSSKSKSASLEGGAAGHQQSGKSSMGSFTDVKNVIRQQVPESATTVLLGECTHGTEEFYQLRADITKYLVEVRKFKVIIVEADWPFLWHVNQYIHRKKLHMFPRNSQARFPEWMWQNRPFVDLIKWMRRMSQTDSACYLFGMDCYCKEESKAELLQFLDAHDPDLAKLLRASCFPRERPEKWPEILSKLQWGYNKKAGGSGGGRSSSGGAVRGELVKDYVYRGCSKLDRFNAEQNLECMIAADEYYEKQRLEPPGSQASWNARDQHMATTIMRLKEAAKDIFPVEKGKEPEELKVIVWAHNSHIGDSTATPNGGVNFERNETWNLGQMCRSILQNVFIVGFYSYCGSVRAAKQWGEQGKVMQLRPALPNSLEFQLHSRFPKQQAFVKLDPTAKVWYGSSDDAPNFALPCQYEFLHPEVLCTTKPSWKSDKVDILVGGAGKNRSSSSCSSSGCTINGKIDIASMVGGSGRCSSGGSSSSTINPGDLQPPNRVIFEAQERQAAVSTRSVQSYRLRGVFGGGQGDLQIGGSSSSSSFSSTSTSCWVDEFTPNQHISLHCLPSDVLERLRQDPLFWMNCVPILQRWVGVQYHPETELQSHYGELVASRAYDMLLFVDESNALNVDFDAVFSDEKTAEQSSAENVQATPAATKRLMKEYAKLLKEPPQGVEAHPMEDNILEWHFRLVGSAGPYIGGRYHGVLEFPPEFPMKPPSIKMLTPSGRFELNRRICLSMSDFHAESWNPSWTVEKILLGLLSFMHEDCRESVGSIHDTIANRKQYAEDSEFFNRQNEIYTLLFLSGDGSAEPSASSAVPQTKAARKSGGSSSCSIMNIGGLLKRSRSSTADETASTSSTANLFLSDPGTRVSSTRSSVLQQNSERTLLAEDERDDRPRCRYCLDSEGELVSPCACRGSSQWVHLACLRQWQKSVLLTQSTHPKYQTRIDAICNICDKPFIGRFKPRDRASQVLEFAGEEMARSLKQGRLLVSSEKESREGQESIEANPELRVHLEHWIFAVFLILNQVNASSTAGEERDSGVLAVNLVMRCKNNRPPGKVTNTLPGYRATQSSPLNSWERIYRPKVIVAFKDVLELDTSGSGVAPGRVRTTDDSAVLDTAFDHFIGGPVEAEDCLAVAYLPGLPAAAEKAHRKRLVGVSTYYGALETILTLAKIRIPSSNAVRMLLQLGSCSSCSPISINIFTKIIKLDDFISLKMFTLLFCLVVTVVAYDLSFLLFIMSFSNPPNIRFPIHLVRESTWCEHCLSQFSGFQSTSEKARVSIFWGYAAWNTSQLLAEVAKRHWGVSNQTVDASAGFRDVCWDDVMTGMTMAKESEYSRN